MPFDPVGFVVTKPALSEIGKICHRAAEIIEKRGWSNTAPECADGSVCMGYAICLASGTVDWNIPAIAQTARHIGFESDDDYIVSGHLACWNDYDAGSADKVIARLRSVS